MKAFLLAFLFKSNKNDQLLQSRLRTVRLGSTNFFKLVSKIEASKPPTFDLNSYQRHRNDVSV